MTPSKPHAAAPGVALIPPLPRRGGGLTFEAALGRALATQLAAAGVASTLPALLLGVGLTRLPAGDEAAAAEQRANVRTVLLPALLRLASETLAAN